MQIAVVTLPPSDKIAPGPANSAKDLTNRLINNLPIIMVYLTTYVIYELYIIF